MVFEVYLGICCSVGATAVLSVTHHKRPHMQHHRHDKNAFTLTLYSPVCSLSVWPFFYREHDASVF